MLVPLALLDACDDNLRPNPALMIAAISTANMDQAGDPELLRTQFLPLIFRSRPLSAWPSSSAKSWAPEHKSSLHAPRNMFRFSEGFVLQTWELQHATPKRFFFKLLASSLEPDEATGSDVRDRQVLASRERSPSRKLLSCLHVSS